MLLVIVLDFFLDWLYNRKYIEFLFHRWKYWTYINYKLFGFIALICLCCR